MSEPHTPQWWAEEYYGSLEAKGIPDTTSMNPDQRVLFDPEKGFLTIGINRELDALIIGKGAGDGRHWEAEVNRIAKDEGVSRIIFMTRRNPEAWARRYGTKIFGYWLEREVR